MTQQFAGFVDSRAAFFKALSRHQKRDWFLAHKQEYEAGWQHPMRLLLEDLNDAMLKWYAPNRLAEPKVHRIYRDIRFSHDKTPYKTYISGMLSVASRGSKITERTAAAYVHIGDGERIVAAGTYAMDGPVLKRYRNAVLAPKAGAMLARKLKPLLEKGYDIASYAQLQRAPRGVDPDHPRAWLLKHKGLILGFPEPPAKLLTHPEFVPWIVKHAKAARPVVEWLLEHT